MRSLMSAVALTCVYILVSRLVLDPETSFDQLPGLILWGLLVFWPVIAAVNWLVDRLKVTS